MGYPTQEEEKNILIEYQMNEPLDDIQATLTPETILSMQEQVKEVKVSEAVHDYLLALVTETRNNSDVDLGISTRGALALMRAAQARAFIRGRQYVTPEDIKELAPFVFEHRLILSMEGSIRKKPEEVVEEILNSIEVPVEVGEGK